MSGFEILLTAASGLASAASTFAAGQASAAASEYNARVGRYQADDAIRRASFEEGRVRDRAERLLSAQRARFAAAGVRASGTPLLVQQDSALQAELDAQAIRYGGLAEANAHRMRAGLDSAMGSATRLGTYFGTGASLLNTVTSVWPSGGLVRTSPPSAKGPGMAQRPVKEA